MQDWQRKLVIFPSDYAKPRREPDDLLRLLVVGTALALIFIPSLRYRFIALLTYPVHYKEYREFGIRIPKGYTVHGIDVSRYQSKVDWEQVREMRVNDIRISFAFIKATEGSSLKDPQFKNNWRNARKNGLVRGAYHYFLPHISPRDQANNFIRSVNLQSGDLPPVVDVEEVRGRSRETVRKNTKIFLDLLEQHYKVRPILYTYRDFYKNHFAGQPAFEGYRFWIAHFHVPELDMPDDQTWHFWQHSDRGSVSGINERVDFNVFNGDSTELRRLCIP